MQTFELFIKLRWVTGSQRSRISRSSFGRMRISSGDAATMLFPPDCISGKRLRKYGVSSAALKRVHVYAVAWFPKEAMTVPIPFLGCVILVRKNLLDVELDGVLADSSALGVLIHQYCHAYQRLQWGFLPYFWRHFWSWAALRGVPVVHRQVERECYEAVRQVEEAHSLPAGEST